jgi:hypothetical protein
MKLAGDKARAAFIAASLRANKSFYFGFFGKF